MKEVLKIHNSYLNLFFSHVTICFVVVQEWKPRWGYKRVNDRKDDWLIEVSDKAGDFKIYPLWFGNRKWGKRVSKKSHSVPPIENFKAFSLYTKLKEKGIVSDIVACIFNVVVNQGGKVLGSLPQ